MDFLFIPTANPELEIKNGLIGFIAALKILILELRTIEILSPTYHPKALDLDTLLKKSFIINLILILKSAPLLMEKIPNALINIFLKTMLLIILLIWLTTFLMICFNANEGKRKNTFLIFSSFFLTKISF